MKIMAKVKVLPLEIALNGQMSLKSADLIWLLSVVLKQILSKIHSVSLRLRTVAAEEK